MENIKTQWELWRYYYESINDPKYIEDKKKIEKLVDEFVVKYEWKIKLFNKVQDFIDFYDVDEKITESIYKVYMFLMYLGSLDTQDQEIIKETAQLQNIYVNLQNKLLFVDQEFKELGYDVLMNFANMPELASYKNAIVRKANSLKYILDEKQEFVLNKKSLPINQLSDLQEEFQNSFMFEIELDWQMQKMTENQVRSLRSDSDEQIRKKAYESLRKVYNTKQSQIVFWNIYSWIVKNWVSNVDIRGYNGVMEPRNISEDMETQVIDMLMKSVQNAYPLFQRYIEAKRKFLKKDKFCVWDTFAPIWNIDTKFSLDESIKMHLDAMQKFDEEFYNYSVEMFEEWRVDVFPKEWKRGWAYCSSAKWEKCFVLLNFTWKLEDVGTISHELGHAIHGYLSQVQHGCVYEPPLSLAETASIFNELLLSDFIKDRLKPEEKIEFLNSQLTEAFWAIFRQIQYVTFERMIHEKTQSGEWLTYEDYNLLWRETQTQMTWDKMIYDVEAKDESGWSMIPHIFRTPFYCYSYAFWNLLSFALYGVYQNRGKEFIKDYKEILAAWGSVPPFQLLSKYGFDITQPEFYNYGIKEIEKMVDEFESLL